MLSSRPRGALDERLAQQGQLRLAVNNGVVKNPSGEPAFRSAAVAHDVTRLGFGIGIEPARFQAGVADELGDFRRRFENRVRPELGEKTVLADGLDHAADAPAGFINRDRNPLRFR